MTTFRDLEPCTYVPWLSDPRLLAIGWLGRGFRHPTGRTSKEVQTSLERLLELRGTRWPSYAWCGVHECTLARCRLSPFRRHADTGEIYVPGDRVIYVAPKMIRHYLSHHRYRPPDEFCAAVRRHRPATLAEDVAALVAIVPEISRLASSDLSDEPDDRPPYTRLELSDDRWHPRSPWYARAWRRLFLRPP